MKTAKEMYQAHTVEMGRALRAASDTLVELSTQDLTPGDLVNAIDDIGTMLVIGREHALRMCIYDTLMRHDALWEKEASKRADPQALGRQPLRCSAPDVCYGIREEGSRYCWAHTPRG